MAALDLTRRLSKEEVIDDVSEPKNNDNPRLPLYSHISDFPSGLMKTIILEENGASYALLL